MKNVEHQGFRQRAAETKRARTRLALVTAARELFEERGWRDTRLEDVAKQAGVSVPTLRNHFKSKYALVMRAYGQVVASLIEKTEGRVYDLDLDASQIISEMLKMFVSTAVKKRQLTMAVAAALLEEPLISSEEFEDIEAVKDGGLPAIAAIFGELIEIGKREGAFNPELNADRVSAYHISGILLMTAMNYDITVEEAERLVLSQVMPALKAAPVSRADPDDEFDDMSV
ncbi:helix-turn-helix domain-containing protein [Amycolatopsis sp. NPDC051102]|uniref:TetR/AcrR family transcriptional regulator n=1 Tax=Amycolatopsis sp. NPDC051102 TaxID=3155163 RepID=UPI00343CB373